MENISESRVIARKGMFDSRIVLRKHVTGHKNEFITHVEALEKDGSHQGYYYGHYFMVPKNNLEEAKVIEAKANEDFNNRSIQLYREEEII